MVVVVPATINWGGGVLKQVMPLNDYTRCSHLATPILLEGSVQLNISVQFDTIL